MFYQNLDLTDIVTPVNANILQEKLQAANYDPDKTRELVNGFKNGFDIGYRGKENRQDKS